jgi:hypothetical protein
MENYVYQNIEVIQIRSRVDVVNYILEFSKGAVKVEDMVDLETFELVKKLNYYVLKRNESNKIFAEVESKKMKKDVKYNKWILGFDDDFESYLINAKKFWYKNVGL